jgi:8-amino-7-oxononanoate synthase
MYAYFALKNIKENLSEYKKEIKKRQELLGIDSLIYMKEYNDDILLKNEELQQKGFLVGAIRPPTVKKPSFRVVARISEDISKLEELKGLIDGE